MNYYNLVRNVSYVVFAISMSQLNESRANSMNEVSLAPRAAPLVAEVPQGILVLGGEGDRYSGQRGNFQDGVIYDALSNEPTAIAPLPFQPSKSLTGWWVSGSDTGKANEKFLVWDSWMDQGALYDPKINSWQTLSHVGLPQTHRRCNAVVWTGKEIVMWGGQENLSGKVGDEKLVNVGYRYDAEKEYWSVLNQINPPTPTCVEHSAWTGQELLIYAHNSNYTSSYSYILNAISGSWRQLPQDGAPSARFHSSSLWTGKEFIVWGGLERKTFQLTAEGARFNVSENRWYPMTLHNAPEARDGNSIVWTGHEMVIVAGNRRATADATGVGAIKSAAAYNPTTDEWRSLPDLPWQFARDAAGASYINSPSPSVMVFGGRKNAHNAGMAEYHQTGAIYQFNTNKWDLLGFAPPGRTEFSLTTLSNHIVTWGGVNDYYLKQMGVFGKAKNVWLPTNTREQVLQPRIGFSATPISDHQLIFWGGWQHSNSNILNFNDGAIYDARYDHWQKISALNAPDARHDHVAVWTGDTGDNETEKKLLVVGTPYYRPGPIGGVYDLTSDSWNKITDVGAPNLEDNRYVKGAWFGPTAHDNLINRLFIFGCGFEGNKKKNVAALFNLKQKAWESVKMPTELMQERRIGFTLTSSPAKTNSSDQRVFIWGGAFDYLGESADKATNTGWVLNASTGEWKSMSLENAPIGRVGHAAVWTGDRLVIFGGYRTNPRDSGYNDLADGGIYDPSTDSWQSFKLPAGWSPRFKNQAVWTGHEVLIWGGCARKGTSIACSKDYPSYGWLFDPATLKWREMR